MRSPILNTVCPICNSESGLVVREANHDPLTNRLILKMTCEDGCGGTIEYGILKKELTYHFLGKIVYADD